MAHEAGQADLRGHVAKTDGHFEQFGLLYNFLAGFQTASKHSRHYTMGPRHPPNGMDKADAFQWLLEYDIDCALARADLPEAPAWSSCA